MGVATKIKTASTAYSWILKKHKQNRGKKYKRESKEILELKIQYLK